MKKTNFFGFAVIALLVIGTLVFTGCPEGDTSENDPVYYTISGTITDNADNSPIEGASVQLKAGAVNQGSAVNTGVDGKYSIPNVPNGTYTIAVSKAGYNAAQSAAFNVADANVTGKDLALIDPSSQIYSISGIISADDTKGPLEDAVLTLKQSETVLDELTTEADGIYLFGNLGNGTYTIEVVLEGYEDGIITVVIANTDKEDQDLELKKLYTVTVVNGNPETVKGTANSAVSISASSAGGTQFIKWVTEDEVDFDNNSASTTTFVMPANDVEVRARLLYPVYVSVWWAQNLWGDYIPMMGAGDAYFRDDNGLLGMGTYIHQWAWMSEDPEEDLYVNPHPTRRNLAIKNLTTGNFVNRKGIAPTAIEDAVHAQQIKVSPFEDDPAFYWNRATGAYQVVTGEEWDWVGYMTLFNGVLDESGFPETGSGIISVLGDFADGGQLRESGNNADFGVWFLGSDEDFTGWSPNNSWFGSKGPGFHAFTDMRKP